MAAEPPKVTVVVPCLNEASTLEPTLDDLVAVMAQSRFDWEVIVVDDGSRDASAEITPYYQLHNRVGG